MSQTTATLDPMDDVGMRMQAIVYDRYGGPEVLSLREVERPAPGAREVLVRVHAASLNALDWHFTTGTPWFMRLSVGLRRPQRHIPGVDLAGTVEAVGAGVSELRLGDEVFGSAVGTCAEYVAAPVDRVVRKPVGLSFEQAAALPVAAITAYQGLVEHGAVRAGHEVLVNGAAGGVGTFAVQIAAALGAHVTAVCSARNVDQSRALGAERVVDYTTEDFVEVLERSGERFDLLFDNVGNRSPRDLRRVLADDATVVVITGPKRNRLLGPLGHVVRTLASFRVRSQRAVMFTAEETVDRLLAVRRLVESGDVTPVVERTYPLEQTAEALAVIGTGHARAKLVIVP